MPSDQKNNLRKIGQLARQFGLNVRTLRYYEKIGLLAPTGRSEGGYRLYSESDERLLQFVLQAKRAGFTLDEIGEIVRLNQHGSACSYVRQTLGRHIEDLDAQIAELQNLRSELIEVTTAWQKSGGTNNDTNNGAICGLIERRSDPLTTTTKEVENMNGQRQVEVFIAGCPLCDETVQLVKSVACGSCEVTIHNLSEGCETGECQSKAKQYGISSVPAVVVNGKLAACCEGNQITAETLRAAGLSAA